MCRPPTCWPSLSCALTCDSTSTAAVQAMHSGVLAIMPLQATAAGAATCGCIARRVLATLPQQRDMQLGSMVCWPDKLSLLSDRYNPNKGLLTLTSEAQETREENRVELLQILRALVEEGRRAFPTASAEGPQQQSATA